MLYEPEASLSREADPAAPGNAQSTRDAEAALREQLATLALKSPGASMGRKQRLIHFVQDKQFRMPHLVVKFGTQIIKSAAGKLGNAVWDLYERVFVSALDCGDHASASWALGSLERKWGGDSLRVQRLRAMGLEAAGDYEQAEEMYQDLLEKDPTSIATLKRQVCVAHGRGELGRAIALLSRYLATFAADEHAWLHLSELQLQAQSLEGASFALEELLLLSPENHTYHTKYADVQLSLGRVPTARQHYAQSLELKPANNLRALYGLVACLQRTGAQGGAQAQNQSQATFDWAAEQLLAHYDKWAPHLSQVAKQTLKGDAPDAQSSALASSTSAASASPAPSPSASPAPSSSAASPPNSTPNQEPQESELPD